MPRAPGKREGPPSRLVSDKCEVVPLSGRSGPRSQPGRDPGQPAPEDRSAFTAMLDEHAAHVLDYCSRLVGDDAEAASATQTAMNAAQTLLAAPDRLRAWLFALARQEIVTSAELPGQDQDAEILDLVYRHGIRPEDLPAVLGVTPEHAKAMLADAEAVPEMPAEIEALAPLDEPAETDGLAPLAEPLPSWIWDRTVGAFFDDPDIDASGMPVTVKALANPSPFARARLRLGFSAIVVAGAGAAVAGFVYLGGSPSGQAPMAPTSRTSAWPHLRFPRRPGIQRKARLSVIITITT